MVHIEAGMVNNQNNHHHIIHHQIILYNILNLIKFPTKRNHPSISAMILKTIMEDEGGSLILTPVGEVDF